jgi:TRAP-type mannitol/chloroaromatic compound transport system permease small subunit
MPDVPQPVRRVVTLIDTFSEWSGKAFAWLIVPLMGGLTWEVVARYAFDAPTFWAYDLAYMLYGSLFLLGTGYTLRRGGHIRTDFLYEKLSVRWQGLIDAIGYLVFFFAPVAFFLWAAWEEGARSWLMGEKADSAWRPPIYPLKLVIPLSLTLLFVQGLAEFLKSAYAAVRGERL